MVRVGGGAALGEGPTAQQPHGASSCSLRRSLCVLAGDISPIDVITHIPVTCEENKIPYIYVPSKEASPA
jgi:hypothetical protein